MYRLLWNYIDRLHLKTKHKQNIFLIVCTLIWTMISTIVWFTVGDDLFGKSLKWMICFIGYPSAILGFLCGILTLFKIKDNDKSE